MCEITTEEVQITSQRAKSGTTIRGKYITFFSDDISDSSQMANRGSQVNS